VTSANVQELGLRAIKLLKKKERTLRQLAAYLKIDVVEAGRVLEYLGKTHPGISRIGSKVFIDEARFRGVDPLTFPLGGKRGRIGVVSCTHYGSKYAQITHLHEFYERCAKEDVEFVVNCGDVTDGDGRVYRGQRYEMHLQGFTEQRDFVVKHYPNQVPTKMIAGNHDDSFAKSAGIDLIAEIVKEREDLDYLGRYAAYMMLGGADGARCKIHHGDGGGAYAVSYKPQKYIEALSSEDKPQLYLLGHFHRIEQLFLRNVHLIQVGCFQAQTPYLVRKSLSPDVGGWILDYEISPDGWSIGAVRVTLVPFYRMIREDYKNYS
jgi:predicted phosphodiesterase